MRQGVRLFLLCLAVTADGAKKHHNRSTGSQQHKHRDAKKSDGEPSTSAGGVHRLDRAIGRMHLQIMRWYCAEMASAHATTVPCENYARMLATLRAKTQTERQALAKAADRNAQGSVEDRAERARLVKASYVAMRTAFCNVPAHQLACMNPDLKNAYDELARAATTPADVLDRKAYHVLTISKRKELQAHSNSATRGSKANPQDSYLTSTSYEPEP